MVNDMRNHHLDIIRVTEAGAIAAAEWVGRGDKEQADKAATDAMRQRLNQVDFCAEIAIGEGKKDESFGLYDGERVGGVKGKPGYSIAVDPIEGTSPTVKGGYEAMSVIAIGEKDSLYKTDCFYMNKIAVGKEVADRVFVRLDNTVADNVARVAMALDKPASHVTVCVMDRPRTEPLVRELRKIGCRIKFISDCDVTACIAACVPNSGIDMYWSIGGAPEAVIAACAMKCMGGYLQCQEVVKTFAEDSTCETWSPSENDKLLHIKDLASGENLFAATGITDGKLLKGVLFDSGGAITNTIAMRSGSGTVRKITTEHGN